MATNNASHNPMGTDGFEFLEFSSKTPAKLDQLFKSLGFEIVAKHKTKAVTLYRQGHVNFLLNEEDVIQISDFNRHHNGGACAMAFRVQDAQFAYKRALELGATPYVSAINSGEESIPAIQAIGGTAIYLVDKYDDKGSIYETDFNFIEGVKKHPHGMGLDIVDHLTHNVHRGNMDKWASFYEDLFNFKEIRYFDIEGKLTGLKSRAMTSPCGKIRIPINESSDDKSQIEEYLKDFGGEGIQHIAMSTDDIYKTVEDLREHGMDFMSTPDSYYNNVEKRIPNHGEDLARMKADRILVDGAPTDDGILLQIFTKTVIGPVFFEIIQRKGNQGFGEGNFKALFESIEEDQLERGVI
ncbi:MAG: 4-hydroxyphenylpyruvate dioxygenase [Alphaproteobacteria bacterium]|jgi:4-hydroxyphenylpyruvate dioxygenase